MEENEERSVHSGMKGAAGVSLCCTKQSQAKHLSLSLHPSIWKIKEKKTRSGGGRKREREEGGALERES